MNEWLPGTPIRTVAHQVQWLAWRVERKRQQQRERRRQLRRIDYHASPDVAAVLERLWRPIAGHDFSSLLDEIVRQWHTSLPPE